MYNSFYRNRIAKPIVTASLYHPPDTKKKIGAGGGFNFFFSQKYFFGRTSNKNFGEGVPNIYIYIYFCFFAVQKNLLGGGSQFFFGRSIFLQSKCFFFLEGIKQI